MRGIRVCVRVVTMVLAGALLLAVPSEAGPGQHTVTVTLNYDFTADNACSAAVTKSCLLQFNIYDLTSGTPYTNYKVSASEAYARGFSWGLMQVMGQVAREAGFAETFLSALCVPEENLAVGCRILKKKLDAAGADTERALLAWNGGANPAYAAQVLARKPRYL